MISSGVMVKGTNYKVVLIVTIVIIIRQCGLTTNRNQFGIHSTGYYIHLSIAE